jgi:hypothetical protein
VLKALGIVVLVGLVLVGALLPLKYTAGMRLPRHPRSRHTRPTGSDEG